MKFYKYLPTIVISLFCLALSFAAVSDFTEYLPVDSKTGKHIELWNACLGLFTQKAGDTMTGNLVFSDVGEGSNLTEGTASAQGRTGTLAYQTGVLDTISNTAVTAKSHVFIQRITGTAHSTTTTYVTNQVGVGFKIITNNPETNTFGFHIIQGL